MMTTSSLCSIWIETQAPRMPFYLLLLLLQLPVWGKGNPDETSDVENEIRRIESKLIKLEMPQRSRDTIHEDPFLHLQHLESILTETQFQEDHKRFGRSKIFANVHKILPKTQNLTIEENVNDAEINQFQVALSETVLTKAKGGKVNQEGRVVMLAATSPVLFKDNDSYPILGGKVIGISVGNTSVHGLLPKERISITFWHNQTNFTASCVFWVMGAKRGDIGQWNTSGCEVKHRENQTTCLCDHLTFFAVLMLPSSDIDKIHKDYLTIITYVGCIISALASLVTIVFLCLRKKQRNHIVYVHINLLWAIFLLDVSFLIAMPLASTRGDMGCKASGMFLHFGVLACLTWMAIEGYSLYRLVIQVFNSYMKCLLVKLSLMGWVYTSPDKYNTEIICWITKKEINNFLNLGYLSLVLLFNSIMLAIMVYEILRLRHREHHWKYVVMLLGLSCILGIPWGLVFFAVASGTFKLVAVYLFTIINSLQGFLIFLWYLAKVLQSRRSNSMQSTTSNSLKLQSSNSSI
ncbi:hypothetical protein E2320_001025 [Naja naja]|nr:hypothetical protein E2320_001025 [Naja naja]